jgi:uncharacterized protein DUF3300
MTMVRFLRSPHAMVNRMSAYRRLATILVAVTLAHASAALAQAPLPMPPQAPLPPSGPPPMYPQAELERIVSPIALYPDPLLAQVLAAATYPADIPDAARWADQHHYLQPDVLAAAIEGDRLPWDPSVQALLPFPSVLSMMASSMPWTQELGDAYLAQQPQVMDAVQSMRQRAREYGYLRSNGRVIVSSGPVVEIVPVNPAFIVVPYYDPVIVYAPPRPRYAVGSAIVFGFGVTIGPRFAPWGWGTTRVDWRERVVVVNNARWGRTWGNRATYVHPYVVRRYVAPRPQEPHRAVERSERERAAERVGKPPKEEHKAPKEDDRKRGRGSDERQRGRGSE